MSEKKHFAANEWAENHQEADHSWRQAFIGLACMVAILAIMYGLYYGYYHFGWWITSKIASMFA